VRAKGIWDGPLKLDFEFEKYALRDAFYRWTPVSKDNHAHDQVNTPFGPRRGNRGKLPRQAGRLRDWCTDLRWYRAIKNGIQVSVFAAYARIIDQGGYVPPAIGETGGSYSYRTGKKYKRKGVRPYMHWAAGGTDKWAFSRDGYSIRRSDFVKAAVGHFVTHGGMRATWAARFSGSVASYTGGA
jgi:hypothetical protein